MLAFAELHGRAGGEGEHIGRKDGRTGMPCSSGARMTSGACSDTVKDIRSAAGTICPPGRKTWLSIGTAPTSRGGTASMKRVCGRSVPPRIALEGNGPGAGGRVNGLNVKGTRNLLTGHQHSYTTNATRDTRTVYVVSRTPVAPHFS